MGLSKTDFMRGMQCPRMLWLDKNRPELKIVPPETQKRLDSGNEFGDKAMGMFGPFEEMTAYLPNTKYPDKKTMVRNTKHHLEIGTENICEAAFDWNGYYCAADIIHRTDTGYEMYEVKNSPEVRREHINDAGYQRFVVEKCGLELEGVYIVYNNGDEEDPFEIADVSDETEEYASVVAENLERLNAIAAIKTEVMTPLGEQCHDPYDCWYCRHCGCDS